MIITDTILLNATDLTTDINNIIFRKLKHNYIGTCTYKYGYIIDVLKITRIIDNTISNINADVIINLEFEVNTILPKVGLELKGIICMVCPEGIFVNIIDNFNILIPKSQLDNFQYINNQFTKDDTTLCNDKQIDIKIDFLKYENNNFSCIGSLC